MRSFTWMSSALAALLALSLPGQAQTLYGLDGAGSLAVEIAGPPGGACAYPNGPLVSAFPTFAPYACPTPMTGGPPPAILGDITVNRLTNTIWVTDGVLFTQYTDRKSVV